MNLKALGYEAVHQATLRRGFKSQQPYVPVRFHPSVARYYRPNYDPAKSRFLLERSLTHGVAIDAGAHIGLFTVALAHLTGRNGTVHAFEASPATADKLERTLKINRCKNVIVHRAAIGDHDGIVEFGETVDLVSNANSLATTERTARTVKVPMVRLDDAVPGAVTLMKVDVEGAEAALLRGAQRILTRWHPPIAMEVHPANLRRLDSSTEEVWALLADAGYTLNIDRETFLSATEDFEVQAVA